MATEAYPWGTSQGDMRPRTTLEAVFNIRLVLPDFWFGIHLIRSQPRLRVPLVVHQEIADRHDAHDRATFGHGKMAHAEIAHHILRLVDGLTAFDGAHWGRHDFIHGEFRHILTARQRLTHQIGIGHDADMILSLLDEERADSQLPHFLRRPANGRGRTHTLRMFVHDLRHSRHVTYLSAQWDKRIDNEALLRNREHDLTKKLSTQKIFLRSLRVGQREGPIDHRPQLSLPDQLSGLEQFTL